MAYSRHLSLATEEQQHGLFSRIGISKIPEEQEMATDASEQLHDAKTDTVYSKIEVINHPQWCNWLVRVTYK
ncbi:hypothetical protein C0J52_15564 [Blattella germanica]|nr:hypothetical protein C0J52_15564 [Blattella germanica]